MVAAWLTIFLFCTSLAVAQNGSLPVESESNPVDQEVPPANDGEEAQQEIERVETLSINRLIHEEQRREARAWFLIILGVMVFLYGGQFLYCLKLARLTRADQATGRRAPTVWDSLWKDVEAQFGTWAFVIMAFVIPFMLGIVPDIATLSGQLFREVPSPDGANGSAISKAGITAEVVYGIAITVLTVLITVEFTYLANVLNQRIWQRMLVVALALDIISLIVLSYFVFDPKHVTHELGGVTILMIGATALSAFLSSFLIIVCVRELGTLNVRAMEAKLSKTAGSRRRQATARNRKESAG